jgi:quercetin dioxygenase-like cupin family protein
MFSSTAKLADAGGHRTREEKMKSAASRIVLASAAIFLVMVSTALSEPLTTAAVTPDELKWVKGPLAMRAVIAGDDKKQGMYVFRARFPANFKAEPHYHPDEKVNMVISGTLFVGYGEEFDESKMKALPAGSIWTEPANQPHFVWAKDGEVVIQVVGNGPSGTILVKPR